MTNELVFFDRQIAERFSCPENKTAISEEERLHLSNSLLLEREAVKTRITETSTALQRKKATKRYVRHQQAMILHLAGLLNNHHDAATDAEEEPATTPAGYKDMLLHDSLENLLFFLKKDFKSYIDADAPIPEYSRKKTAGRLREQERKVRNTLTQRRIPARLITVALAPALEFIQNPRGVISLRQLEWVEELLNELERLTQRDELRYDLETELILLLCYLNLNTVSFYDYCVDRCRQIRDNAASQESAVAELSRLLKFAAQFRQKVDFCYRCKQESIKSLMVDWLEKEIDFRTGQLKPPSAENKTADPVADEKPWWDMNRTELGYFILLLVEAKMLNFTNRGYVPRFFASFFNCKLNQPLLVSTLTTRFKELDAKTAETVREKLEKLIAFSLKHHRYGK